MQIGVCQARIDWSGDDIINASNTKIKLTNGNNLASKISPSLRGEKDLIKTKRSYFLFIFLKMGQPRPLFVYFRAFQ